MDALLPILCLLIGVALPVGLGAVLVRRVHRQTAAPAAYRAVARRLGLGVDTRGASVNGYLADQRRKLYIGEMMVGHGTDRSTQFRAVLSLTRPLGLGLSIQMRTGRQWFRGEHGHEIQTGHAAFDKHFKVNGDDDERIRALLTDDLRAQIEALGSTNANLLISDHHVRALLHRPLTESDALFALIGQLQQLADTLGQARSQVSPPARMDAQRTVLADLAMQRDLTFEPDWPAISGAINDWPMELCIRREPEGYRAEVTGWLKKPRDMGFRLRRQTEPDGYWSVGQDIQVNDPLFDDNFVIKGFSPLIICKWLNPVARERLSSAADLGDLVANDHFVRITRLALDAGTLREAIDKVAGCLRALEP